MAIAFVLSMPGVNSWNGRWSGEENTYALVRSMRSWPTVDGEPVGASHRYNFGDGWAASVDIKEVDAPTARKLRRKSSGFCGYDWMVDSILKHGRIMSSLECSEHGKQLTASGGAGCPACRKSAAEEK